MINACALGDGSNLSTLSVLGSGIKKEKKMKEEEKECPVCGGTGSAFTCPGCGAQHPSGCCALNVACWEAGNWGAGEEEECHQCKGTGKVPNDDD